MFSPLVGCDAAKTDVLDADQRWSLPAVPLGPFEPPKLGRLSGLDCLTCCMNPHVAHEQSISARPRTRLMRCSCPSQSGLVSSRSERWSAALVYVSASAIVIHSKVVAH